MSHGNMYFTPFYYFTFAVNIFQPDIMLEAFLSSRWTHCKNNTSFLYLLLGKMLKSIAELECF